jgi:sulfite reductase alpha subunit-like flavoprotein
MNKTLQEKVKQDLEKKGVLNQIRQMFKDKIYQSLKSQQNSTDLTTHSKNKNLDSRSGRICCRLVQDFLESFGLGLTLSIFLPEAHLDNTREEIQALEDALDIKTAPKRPILFEVIDRNAEEENFSQVESIKEDLESQSSHLSYRDQLFESAGNSQGYDQSANSLAMNEFDYIEPVRRTKL